MSRVKGAKSVLFFVLKILGTGVSAKHKNPPTQLSTNMPPRSSSVKNNGVDKKASAGMPIITTRKQRDTARERGDIRGWIGLQSAKQAVGRPKKALDRSGTNVDNEEQEAKKQKMKKAEKQKAAELIDEAQRSEAMPVLMELMGRFETADKNDNNLEDGIKALSANVLKDILKYYYSVKIKGMSTMKKPDLVMAVINQFLVSREARPVVV